MRRRDDVLEVHRPHVIRVTVGDAWAEATMEARQASLDGAAAWAAGPLAWAIGWLGGDESAWWIAELPLCFEVVGFQMAMGEVDPRRWVGANKGALRPIPDAEGNVATLHIGGPDSSVVVVIYAKSAQMSGRDGEALREWWAESGWDGEQLVTRVEARFSAGGLDLRPRAKPGHAGLGLDGLDTLSNPMAMARLVAHAVGHPDHPHSGRYRFLAKPKGEVDPRWKAIQEAAQGAPVERLSGVRRRRAKEHDDQREKAERRLTNAVGEVARFDGFKPGQQVAARRHMRDRVGQMDVGSVGAALVRADAIHGDILEDEGGSDATSGD